MKIIFSGCVVALFVLVAVYPSAAQVAGEEWVEPVTGMEFVWVPGGCYEMGCGAWTEDCDEDEFPVHEVCVDSFWMGKYEVTQGQWAAVMGGNPSYFANGDSHPVERVSWEDSQAFIEQLESIHSGATVTIHLPMDSLSQE
ncbi:MAG: formylglycine-generating enzyme family protein [Desulfovibrio sp.]|nr:MAG: formylglycine-generating enzyme family protein [Desulfovibrio sp.]